MYDVPSARVWGLLHKASPGSATGSCSRLLLQLLAPAAEEPPQPMLQRSTKKEVRLRSLKFKGGNFEAPRPEEEDTLRAEFTPLASPALR